MACLATLCGVSYEAALLAIGTPTIFSTGVMLKVVRAAAKQLGRPLVLRRHWDSDEDTGMLALNSLSWDSGHLVILREGIIIDLQELSVWDLEDYVQSHHATMTSLLVLKGK